jgi:hypothetical protein
MAFPEGSNAASFGLYTREEALREVLIYQRDVDPDDACRGCRGWGRKAYPDTTTWRGGAGGQSITSGVCDECWGSGDPARPWADLRKVERAMRAFDKAIRESDYCAACDSHPSSGHAKGCVMS